MSSSPGSAKAARSMPCPFCGEDGYSTAPIYGFGYEEGKKVPVCRVECVCGAHGPTMKREKAITAEAIEAWNTRIPAHDRKRERGTYRVEHDEFVGTQIGSYVTLEGKEGVVLQQIGTRVVHVYGKKWIMPS